jgi:formate C-acetyltransferase
MSINFNDEKYANVGSWQEVFEEECSDRVKKAKKRVLTDMVMCVERSEAYMKTMQEYPDVSGVILRARMFERYLNDKVVFILEDELIAGNANSHVRGGTIAPEKLDFIDKELDDPEKDFQIRDLERAIVTPETRKKLREELIPFFKGKVLTDAVLERAGQDLKDKAFAETAVDPHIPVIGNLSMTKDLGHQSVDYQKVLYKGITGIREEVIRHLTELDMPYDISRKKEKRDFYEAVLITLDAAIAYAKRYADLARQMAVDENDPKRKGELERIAVCCDRVPAYPARDWYEACQSFWMTHLLVLCETWNVASTPGAFDRFMYPFYKKSAMSTG